MDINNNVEFFSSGVGHDIEYALINKGTEA
jgi:hypothetical protein